MSTAFFYGTLMVPAILNRVTMTDGSHLEIAPAMLMDHTRHQVKDMDYPAVINSTRSRELMKRELNEDERCVRGVLVKGLSPSDISFLDDFEGTAYQRSQVTVLPLADFEPLMTKDTKMLLSPDLPIPSPPPAPIEASTYIWTAPLSWISTGLWSYETFMDEKLHRWVGQNPDESEADRQLEADGREAQARHANNGDVRNDMPTVDEMASAIEGGPNSCIPNASRGGITFGHAMRPYFSFESNYINLNNGSYGSLPLPVSILCEKYGRISERSPDQFIRRTYLPLLNEVRHLVAQTIGANDDECFIVPCTSHGIDTVLYNLDVTDGDVLVGFSTSYRAVNRSLHHIVDRKPNVALSLVPLVVPSSHDSILAQFRAHLGSLRRSGTLQKIVVVIDAISSMPAVKMPWEEMIPICKEYGAISIIDAAHAIGQVPCNVGQSAPDFWVSNCHKWLFSKRGSAVLYIPKRNQHMIMTTLPTSTAYLTRSDLGYPAELSTQFEWTGTQDSVPYLSIAWALNFRKAIGGEKRIMDYCHFLALAGGKVMADRFGTYMLDNTPSGELTASMVDVLLPLSIAPEQSIDDLNKILAKLQDGMLVQGCFAAPHVYNGRWWIRASAQIWLEISDFEQVADVLISLCTEIGAET